MKHLENVQKNSITSNETGAKKIAPSVQIKGTQMQDTSEIAQVCEEALKLERCGEYREALEIFRLKWLDEHYNVNLNGLTPIDSANLLLSIGSILSLINDSEVVENPQLTARDFFSQSETIFIELNNLEGRARALNKIAVSYYIEGDLPAARIYLDDSIGYAQTDESKAIALLNISMVEHGMFNYSVAIEYAEKASLFFGRISTLTEGKIRARLGNTFEAAGKEIASLEQNSYFDKALIEYAGAIVCFETIGDKKSEMVVRNNLGYLFYAIERHEDALRELEVAKMRSYQLQDKVHIGGLNVTIAKVHIKLKDFNSALSSTSTALKYLIGNENPAYLFQALIIHAIVLSNLKSKIEARNYFRKAEETAEYIGNRSLIAQAQLFALNELFSEYNQTERAQIFDDVRQKLSDSKEKGVIEAIEEVAEKLAIETVESVADESPSPPDFISQHSNKLKSELEKLENAETSLIEKQREVYAAALRQTKGNRMQAAKLLGIRRQTMNARIKRKFPDLLETYKQLPPKKETVVKAFPAYLIPNVTQLSATIGLLHLNEKYYSAAAGDILLVEIGTWYFNHTVALRNFYGTSGPTLIGIIRNQNLSFALEQPDGKKFDFHNEQLIIGNVIGYCRKDEFDGFLEQQKAGNSTEMPVRKFNF